MKKIVMIVDDDEVVREETRYHLSSGKTDFEFQEFSNGFAALQHLESLLEASEALPSVIVLDLMMPRMDGIEFLNEVEAMGMTNPCLLNIPVVTVTACDDQVLANRCRSFDSVTAVIRKLNSGSLLLPLVEEIC